MFSLRNVVLALLIVPFLVGCGGSPLEQEVSDVNNELLQESFRYELSQYGVTDVMQDPEDQMVFYAARESEDNQNNEVVRYEIQDADAMRSHNGTSGYTWTVLASEPKLVYADKRLSAGNTWTLLEVKGSELLFFSYPADLGRSHCYNPLIHSGDLISTSGIPLEDPLAPVYSVPVRAAATVEKKPYILPESERAELERQEKQCEKDWEEEIKRQACANDSSSEGCE